MTWLTRYPWPTEIIMDRGKEFSAEVSKTIQDEYGIAKKLITTRNPQANAIIERIHQVVHNMIRTRGIKGLDGLDSDFGWDGVLAAARSLVQTTMQATPTQLVFGHDVLLNASFKADWQYIKEQKQKLIVQKTNERMPNASHTNTLPETVSWYASILTASTVAIDTRDHS